MTQPRSAATMLHVDLDAFFASVELLDKPHLVGKPAVVAHESGRSVVTSATYEARRLGIRSAMPLAHAQRLCPNLIVLPPHRELYTAASQAVMQIFRDITPLVEPLSIDEAFLDVSGAGRLFGTPTEIAALIRSRVLDATGLTCSVGGGGTKFVAKVASQRAKPDGVLIVHPSRTLEFLHPLPVSVLWGVGGVTGEHLRRLGVNTVGDLAALPIAALRAAVGEASSEHLHNLAHGHDVRQVNITREEKSISNESTFEYDVSDPAEVRQQLLRLSLNVGERVRNAGVLARTVGIKIRWDDFRTVTRSRTLPEPTSVGRQIYEEAVQAFNELDGQGKRVRLVGVRAENLVGTDSGGSLLWDPYEQWRDAEQAIDTVSQRFGRHSVTAAALLRPESQAPDRNYTKPSTDSANP